MSKRVICLALRGWDRRGAELGAFLMFRGYKQMYEFYEEELYYYLNGEEGDRLKPQQLQRCFKVQQRQFWI